MIEEFKQTENTSLSTNNENNTVITNNNANNNSNDNTMIETDVLKVKMDNKKEKCKSMAKVVIRRLPSTMTKSQFIEQVSPLPDHDYLYFVRADPSLGVNAFSRAYINFQDQQDIFMFREKFDNYVFVDAKGMEYPAVVEFAPFQRLPKKRVNRKKDPKCGTIESDHYYISFLESLQKQDADSAASQPKTEYSYQPFDNAQKKVTTTPLLEYLKQRKAEKQRIKDEKREERRKRDLERRRVKDEPTVSKVLKNPETERDNKENKDDKDVKVSPKDMKNRNRRDDVKMRDKNIGSRDRDAKGSTKNYRDRDDKKLHDRDTAKNNIKKHEDKKMHNKRDERDNYTRDDKKYDGKGYFKDDRRDHRDDSSSQHSREKNIEEKKGKSYEKMRQEKRRMNELKKEGSDEMSMAGTTTVDGQKNVDKNTRIDSKKVSSKNDSTAGLLVKSVSVCDDETNDNLNEPSSTNTNTNASNNNNSNEHNEHNRETVVVDDSKSELLEETYKVDKVRLSDFIKTDGDTDNDGAKASRLFKIGNISKRRSSLESGGEGGSNDNAYLRRHKSLDGGDDDDNLQKIEIDDKDKDKKDPRLERRIRNKDRPAMEIYRPGMGRFSKQRLEREKSNHDDRASQSQSPTPCGKNGGSIKCNDNNNPLSATATAVVSSELRSMTFKRSVSRDNP